MGNQCGATPSDPYHANLCMLSYRIDILEKSDGKTIHLRQKAVEAVLNGAKLVEVSELFGISIRTVQRWLKMWSETGDYRPKQNYQKGHSAQITDWEGFRQFV